MARTVNQGPQKGHQPDVRRGSLGQTREWIPHRADPRLPRSPAGAGQSRQSPLPLFAGLYEDALQPPRQKAPSDRMPASSLCLQCPRNPKVAQTRLLLRAGRREGAGKVTGGFPPADTTHSPWTHRSCQCPAEGPPSPSRRNELTARLARKRSAMN